MKKALKYLTLALLMLALIVGLATPSHAEEELICASVYPCSSTGELLPQYDVSGNCGDQYRLLCSKAKASQMSDELVSCQKENESLKGNEVRLAKKIRNLRQQLRNAQ